MAALFKRKDSNATLDEPHEYSKDKGQSARPRMSVLWRSVHVMTGMVVTHADTYAHVAGGWSLRGRPCWPCGPGPAAPCGPGPRVRPQHTQKGEPGMAPGHGHHTRMPDTWGLRTVRTGHAY